MIIGTRLWQKLDTWLLLTAAVLAIGAVVLLFDLREDLKISQTIFIDDLPSYSVRAEYDLAMLIAELNAFLIDSSRLPELQQRYEVLVARLLHYEAAFLKEFRSTTPQMRSLIEPLRATALDIEDSVLGLSASDTANALQLQQTLQGMRPSLAELSSLTRRNQFIQYLQIDRSLSNSLLVGALMLASTLVLGAITIGRFWYHLREKTRFSEVLESRIRERTRDLQLSNDALKHEIIERQRAERSLAEKEQQMHRARKMEAIGRTTAGVAHDFNNLLAVIMGNIELLAARSQDERLNRYIDNALSASIMGSQLTRKLLAFGRRSTLRPETLDLNAVVRDISELLNQSISEVNTLETRLADGLHTIRVDRSLLENVLLNLVNNARDALPGGGVITLETSNLRIDGTQGAENDPALPAGDYARITVSDEGSGMTPEVLDQAIEPFFTTKFAAQGSGLGLSMAYGFAQQSLGLMQVSSQPDRGTTVALIFPATQSGEAPCVAPRELPFNGPRERHHILVAEDSPAVRATVVELLQIMGHTTVEARSGVEALRHLREDPDIDLLISDVVMPGEVQGPQLVERAREQRPALKIVFMSGYPKGLERIDANDAIHGMAKLMKPVSMAMLTQVIQQLFESDDSLMDTTLDVADQLVRG